MGTISSRLREIVELKTTETRRHKEMEINTKLPADLWKAWWHGKQRPNEEMIQAVCKKWPDLAFWLATGIDDWWHGHNSPRLLRAAAEGKMKLRTAAADVFAVQITLAELEEASPSQGPDDPRLATFMHYWEERRQLLEIRTEQAKTLSKYDPETDDISF